MKFRATLYPSVESDDYECEAESREEAREIIQEMSNCNYCFVCMDSDIEEVEDD